MPSWSASYHVSRQSGKGARSISPRRWVRRFRPPRSRRSRAMSRLAVTRDFIGFEVISKVPTILHTPLMSGSNAIHGIILIGALLVAAHAQTPGQVVLGFVAVVLATINVVGGFVVTDRMLEMFQGRTSERKAVKEP